ncbi:MAG: RNA-binding protein [Pseudomonadota bacterium]
MKSFVLDSSMLTMGGVFYPTGHMFMMFPTEQQARDAAQLLEADGLAGEEISLLTPQVIQEKVARTVGNADIPLPSAGTEADTVRHFLKLASEGHFALLVHAPDAKDSDRVMEVLKDANMSYGQKYRQLVIEDLE